MDHYAGIDVSLECSSVCVIDTNGKIVRETKVASEPEALIGWFGSLRFGPARIGLEAGPLSQWLYAAMKEAGLAVELLETRHVSDAFKAMPVKSDRNDARNIAQLDAARLVPAGALQVAKRTGDPCDVDGTEADPDQAAGRREQPAGDLARLWAEGSARRPGQALPAGSRNWWKTIQTFKRSARRCFGRGPFCWQSSTVLRSGCGRCRAFMRGPGC